MGDWEVDVHETFAGQQLLDVADIVQASNQTTKLAGTGMGTHVLQLRDVGLVSKTPTDAERAYVDRCSDCGARRSSSAETTSRSTTGGSRSVSGTGTPAR